MKKETVEKYQKEFDDYLHLPLKEQTISGLMSAKWNYRIVKRIYLLERALNEN